MSIQFLKLTGEQAASIPEGQNTLKRNQLRQLAALNGTLRDDENQACQNCEYSKVNPIILLLFFPCISASHLSKLMVQAGKLDIASMIVLNNATSLQTSFVVYVAMLVIWLVTVPIVNVDQTPEITFLASLVPQHDVSEAEMLSTEKWR